MNLNKFDQYIFNLKNSFEINRVILIICFLITYFVLIPYLPTNYNYKFGDIAKSDIKSPKNLTVYDQDATKEKIKRLKENIFPVYDFDTEILDNIKEKVSLYFEKCRQNIPIKDNNIRIQLRKELEELCNCKIRNSEFRMLERKKFSEDIEWILMKLISHYMEKGIVSNNSKIDVYKNRGVIIRLLPSNEEIEKKDIYTFYKLNIVKKLIQKNYIAITGHYTKPYVLRRFLTYLATHFVQPNLHYNKIETEKRKNEIEKKVKPVYYIIKKNEIIVREGSPITKESLAKLNAIKKERNTGSLIRKCISILILLFLFSFIIYQIFLKDLAMKLISARDVLFFCVVITFSAVILRILTNISYLLSSSFSDVPMFFYFLIPSAITTILLKITVNEKYAFASSIFVSFFMYILVGPVMMIYSLLGSLYIILRTECCSERFTFIKVGFELGTFNLLAILGLSILYEQQDFLSLSTGINIFAGIINGIFTSTIFLGIIPIVEILFRYTSELRLLELGSLEHPLLQEFSKKAPGSYQHSILVGRLSESAAKEIGANSLLARVGAYFHDIGKINKPFYFIENISNNKLNKHNNITPNMSALILISHVKEGVELAKKYKLGDEIVDIIKQHHGTSLIKFFYKKALEINEGDSKQDIDEKNFRYPGPKPKTKETGIIMLADVLEASSRTLNDPTPARIKGFVKNMIEAILNDGQLDECRLTLKELTTIRDSFVNTLTSIYHHRIEYPKDDKPNSTNKN